MNNIQHDEKKIEDFTPYDIRGDWAYSGFKAEILEQLNIKLKKKAKKYAEHMVQQERERVLNIVKLLEFNAPKKYDIDPKHEQAELLNTHIMPVLKDIIIKAINQEDHE